MFTKDLFDKKKIIIKDNDPIASVVILLSIEICLSPLKSTAAGKNRFFQIRFFRLLDYVLM